MNQTRILQMTVSHNFLNHFTGFLIHRYWTCFVVIFLSIHRFLTIVTLRGPETPAFIGIEPNRTWILSILHKNLKLMPCTINEFGSCVISVARQCSQAAKAPEQNGLTATQVSLLRNNVLKLWALFPDFCHYGVTDVHASFGRLAPVLDGCLKDSFFPEVLFVTLLYHIVLYYIA